MGTGGCYEVSILDRELLRNAKREGKSYSQERAHQLFMQYQVQVALYRLRRFIFRNIHQLTNIYMDISKNWWKRECEFERDQG